MSELNIAHWARKRAAELINVDSSTFTPDTIYESSAATAFAQYIEEHEEAPLTLKEQACRALAVGLNDIYGDHERGIWRGTAYYAPKMLDNLETQGYTIVAQDSVVGEVP